ncbi:MAG: sel1 repeat family protein [Hyphomicrobiales bacterium]
MGITEIEEGAINGDRIAQFLLGTAYAFEKDKEENARKAFEWNLKSAIQGYDHAQVYIGMAYQIGDGVKKDDKNALLWFHKSAEQGNPSAMYQIGSWFALDNNFLWAYVFFKLSKKYCNGLVNKELIILKEKLLSSSQLERCDFLVDEYERIFLN